MCLIAIILEIKYESSNSGSFPNNEEKKYLSTLFQEEIHTLSPEIIKKDKVLFSLDANDNWILESIGAMLLTLFTSLTWDKFVTPWRWEVITAPFWFDWLLKGVLQSRGSGFYLQQQ